MGIHLGPSFPNALPLTEAREDPRRSLLYRTIVRSPLVPPEAFLRASRYRRQGLGQFILGRPVRVPVDVGRTASPILTVARRRAFREKVLTRPTITASQAFPQNYSAPGGGIRIERPRVRVDFDTEESIQAKIKRWLEEETLYEGVKNKWFAGIGAAIALWKL